MAKTKSSQFSKVISDLKKSNMINTYDVSLLTGEMSELKKDLSNLENTVLLIMEKMRRKEQYPIVQLKGGKLAAPKIASKSERLSAVPANDPIVGDLENETSKNILIKMYNFMVRKAEDDKNRQKYDRKQKLSTERKRQQTYRKELIKAGLDPKMFKKKKGLLGKIGTGIKWGIFGAIGAGLAGLVWLFKEEITEFSKSLTKSITELGKNVTDSLQTVTTFLTGIYNRFLKP